VEGAIVSRYFGEISFQMPFYVLRHRGAVHRVSSAETLIGRSDECAFRIDHAKVSRVHALVRLTKDELEITDLGSMNGTRVNGQRVLGPRRLKTGDVVKVGVEIIEVFTEDAAPASFIPPAPITAPPTTEPLDDFGAALDTLEVVEAMLSSYDLSERPLETAQTVRTLLDEALEGFLAEGGRLDHPTAERIAHAVNRISALSPADSTGPWEDSVAERLKALLG
jgi:predicted component of type VI protein secretion system